MGMEVFGNVAATYQGSKPAAQPQTQSYQTAENAQAILAGSQISPVMPAGRADTGSNSANGDGQNQQPTEQQIKSAISSANKRAHFGHTNAEFSYHEPTKRISVKIIDNETNEVIREIPPEETLEMIAKMWELAGIMVDEKR